MSHILKIDTDAFKNIQETIEWSEMQSKGLRIRYNEIRCKKIEKFPFLIHYTINEIEKTILIFAVFHTSRNPEIWKNRNK